MMLDECGMSWIEEKFISLIPQLCGNKIIEDDCQANFDENDRKTFAKMKSGGKVIWGDLELLYDPVHDAFLNNVQEVLFLCWNHYYNGVSGSVSIQELGNAFVIRSSDFDDCGSFCSADKISLSG